MAKISITIEGSSVGSITVSDTLTQENSDRFMSWLASSYGKNPDGEDRTPTEMIAGCWAAIRSGIFANIESFEREVAAQAAQEAIVPMESQTSIGS